MITMQYVPSRSVSAVIKASNLAYNASFRGIRQGIKECGELLLKASRKIVPIKSGDLYNSSRTYTQGRSRVSIQQVVEYRMVYALMQHENLHFKHKPGKSAKYLEKPARQLQGRMANIVKKRARIKS